LVTSLREKNPEGIEGPLAKPKIVFIAHSTGGLIVRYLLMGKQKSFEDKIIGLVLLASPSRGSAWADRLKWLQEYYNHRMVGELARDNALNRDLDQRFAELVSNNNKKIKLVGIDIFENKFIYNKYFFWNYEPIVPAKDAASYFGAYKIIPDSDHFSIAKPTSITHNSHRYLYDFFVYTFLPAVLDQSSLIVTTDIDRNNAIKEIARRRVRDEFADLLERRMSHVGRQLKAMTAHGRLTGESILSLKNEYARLSGELANSLVNDRYSRTHEVLVEIQELLRPVRYSRMIGSSGLEELLFLVIPGNLSEKIANDLPELNQTLMLFNKQH
jgi:hypothetical protein